MQELLQYENTRTIPNSPIKSKEVDDLIEANQYEIMFERAFQYFQSRCQHHIHMLVNGEGIVPNTCRSKLNSNECKHEAPWTNRVSPPWRTSPLLICKCIAKKLRLRCSGFRNWLVQTLFLHNEAWVNETMPGLDDVASAYSV